MTSSERYLLGLVKHGEIILDGEGRFWRGPGMRREGKRAEAKRKDGMLRLSVTVDGHRHLALAHRIVYLMTHGSIPSNGVVCHLDNNPSNNRPANLYATTLSELASDRACLKRLAQ